MHFIRNGVSSNKGVLIADIYIRTTVYINLKNIPPREPRGIEIGPSFSAGNHSMNIHTMFGFNLPSGFRGED
jgi:hypothetical protein